jgi:RNA polymerase sigma-70 factor (ECF subfamily)
MAFHMIGNEEDARDLTQEIFIRAFVNLDKVDPHYKFFSWLYRLGLNYTLDYLRQRRSFVPLEDMAAKNGFGQDEYMYYQGKSRNVRKAIRSLKPKYRLLIVMKYYSAMSYDQISSITGIPEARVKSRLFDAREMLRKFLNSMSDNV